MLDIEKAIAAAFSEKCGTQARTSFVRFLMRTSRTELPATQWRTIGAESAMVKAFLDALGFTDGDYEAYTSRLDPDVVDFKWTPSGRFSELASELAQIERTGQDAGTSPLTRLLMSVHGGSAEIPDIPECRPDQTAETVQSGPFPVRVEEVSADVRRMLRDVCVDINSGRVQLHPHIVEAVDPTLGVTYNGVMRHVVERLSAINPGPVYAVEDPWILEAAVRLLPPTALKGPTPSEMPQFALFAPLKSHEYSWTAIRHVSRSERIPGLDHMLSGILAEDRRFLAAEDGSENPLVTYMTNSAASAAAVDLAGKDAVFGVASAPLNGCDRVRALVYATGGRRFWAYLQDLYKAVYNVNAGIERHARVGFTSMTEPWRNVYGYGAEMEDACELDYATAVATYAFTLAPGQVSAKWDAAMAPVYAPVHVASPDERPTESQFAMEFSTTEDVPGLWFSLVHSGGRDWGAPSNWRYHISAAGSAGQLAKFRARYGSVLPRTIERMSTVGKSKYLTPDYSRSGTPVYEGPSSIVTGVAQIIRRHLTVPLNGPLTHPDTDRHPSATLVSNVYSCAGDLKWSDSAGFTALMDGLMSRQLTPATGQSGATLVLETNVPAASVFVTGELGTEISRLLWNVFIPYVSSPDMYDRLVTGSVPEYFKSRVADSLPMNKALPQDGSLLSALPSDMVSVRTTADSFGRLHVVVHIHQHFLEYALAMFRYRMGVRPVSAKAMADNSQTADECRARADDMWNADELFDAVVRRIVSTFRRPSLAVDCIEHIDAYPVYGFGPVIATMHSRSACVKPRSVFVSSGCFKAGDMLA